MAYGDTSIAQQRASDADAGPNADTGNSHTQTASGRGAVIGGDASAKTSMGGGSSGGSGGGGGGGGGGYSAGASLASSVTASLGFSGDAGNKLTGSTFGAFQPNFDGTQTNGLSGNVVALIAAGVVALLLVLGRKG